MRWRLVLEEYGPQLHYIKGENNIIADALSRLDIQKDSKPPTEQLEYLSELYGMKSKEIPKNAFPINLKLIQTISTKR